MTQPDPDFRVSDIGEHGLLQRLQQYCPPGMIGDDAAVLTVEPGRSLVVSTDVLVDGVHFSLGLATPQSTMTPADAGWRAIATNLSDLAAMGAAPIGLTVGLSLPGEVPVDWIEDLYRGMADCAQTYGTAIAGGDICRSPVLSLAITALGHVAPHRILKRTAAQPGDAIVATGVHGASRAGLERLLHPDDPCPLTADQQAELKRSHQRPRPRLDVGPILDSIGAWTGDRALAGMDSSDGLADAVVQICQASGVGATLERSQLPILHELADWRSPEQALDWTLYGGEDFELVLCLPVDLAKELVRQLPEVVIMGTVTAAPDIILCDRTNPTDRQVLSLRHGFQHF
jgi:thiamine-monophosphate kinase